MDKPNVRIIFAIPTECNDLQDVSEEMLQAYEACQQNNIDVNWFAEKECQNIELDKTDFIVFQTFRGETFDIVRQTKSVRIVGPWCLLTCLTEGRQIPNFPWPICSVAMSGCTITCSSIPKAERKGLQDKIQYMAGFFSLSLTDNCTHLVTESVKSEKYIKAAEKTGVKLLLSSWVDDVWESSRKGNVHCDNKQFIEKHRCPTFHKLVVCCTGLNSEQRNTLNKLITENGGVYREQLHVSSTDILVCSSTSLSSTKYKAAKKRHIKCVNFDWAMDSVKNGYAMPDNLYPIKVKTSTPTKEGELSLPNFSMISCIENSTMQCNRSVLQDTINATDLSKMAIATPVRSNGVKRKSDSNEHNDLVDDIDVRQVKMAGPFLDGCGIYLIGFGTEQREKLCKVLNFSGATRYDDISERVTHVLVGDSSCHEFKLMASKETLKSTPLVTTHWLLDSISRRCPADEQNYLVNTKSSSDEPSSPLSKKSVHLLRRESTASVASDKGVNNLKDLLCEAEPEADLVQQYLRPDEPNEEDTLAKLLQDADSKQNAEQQLIAKVILTQSEGNRKSHTLLEAPSHQSLYTADREASLSSAVDDSSQPTDPIYEGLKFVVVGFTEEQQEQVKLAIEAMAGQVVSKIYKGIPDYAVVPVFSSELKQVATEIVTDLWISECWQENEIRPIEYFHRPISVNKAANPLRDCVVTISSYINYERNFLRHLIMQLGGICQEQFSRINSSNAEIVASTHLVSPVPSGKKYVAALKWGLPVVTKDWLIECAHNSKLPSERSYLVGESKCPSRRDSGENEEHKTHDPPPKRITPPPKSPVINNVQKSLSQIENSVRLQSSVAEKLDNMCNTPPTNGKLHLNELDGEPIHTPVNRASTNALNNSEISSQVTPVQKIMKEAKKNNLLCTPRQSLSYPKPWNHVDTPDTPLGAFINPNPSPHLRKEMLRYLNSLPEHRPRRESTPLSELKRRLWDKICPPRDSQLEQPNFNDTDDANETATVREKDSIANNLSDSVVDGHLQQLQAMLTSSGEGGSRSRRQSTCPAEAQAVKDSQPNTVGWDDCAECDFLQQPNKVPKVFMFSGIEQDIREQFIERLESVGGVVSNLANFDPSCTHLICSKPMRNEKVLACIASGKWILHSSYVDKCFEEGKLIDEEPFEYGNPKSRENVHMQANKENETRILAMHYWRKEISKRGYGPFHNMRAIVVAQKKESIVRVIEAGGGMVVDANSPFTQPIHATHCLLDLKFIKDMSDYIPLAKQGIYCVNTLYISEYLQRTAKDIRDYIVPSLASHYCFK